MTIANKQEAQAFLSKVKPEADGLPSAKLDGEALDNYIEACRLVGQQFSFVAYRDKCNKQAAADAKPVFNGKVTPKVSRKGALSLYGLQRNPVTLYVEQWERVFAAIPEIQKFIASNPTEDYPEWSGKDRTSGKMITLPAVKATLNRKAGDTDAE